MLIDTQDFSPVDASINGLSRGICLKRPPYAAIECRLRKLTLKAQGNPLSTRRTSRNLKGHRRNRRAPTHFRKYRDPL